MVNEGLGSGADGVQVAPPRKLWDRNYDFFKICAFVALSKYVTLVTLGRGFHSYGHILMNWGLLLYGGVGEDLGLMVCKWCPLESCWKKDMIYF